MPTIQQIVRAVFFIIIAAAICWLLWWLIGYLALPDPFGFFARGVVAVGAVAVLIGILLELAGYPTFKR
jgi:hypothetical protein